MDFDRFEDSVMIEILCRLPTPEFATKCKVVCKKWERLTSDNYFVRRFVGCRIGHLENELAVVGGEPFLVAVRHAFWEESTGLVMCMDNPSSDIPSPRTGFLVYTSLLPWLPNGVDVPAQDVVLIGGNTDILLYCSEKQQMYDYSLYNLQTKELVSLPSPIFYHGKDILNGFVHERFYSAGKLESDGSNSIVLNLGSRFSVVAVPSTLKAESEYHAHLYLSTAHQWVEVLLSLPTACTLVAGSGSFEFGGRMHFRGVEGFISFDPFASVEGVIQCNFVRWPVNLSGTMASTGVFEGKLQVANFDDDLPFFSVYVLDDYSSGKWYCRYKVGKDEWVCDDAVSYNRDHLNWPGYVIGQNPINPNIFYLISSQYISRCDVAEATLIRVCSLQLRFMDLYAYFVSFPLSLPIWPTPLKLYR